MNQRRLRARPPKLPPLGRWQQVLADALDRNFAIGVRAAVANHLGRAPTWAELTAARRAAHGLARLGRARVYRVPGTDADTNTGDRTYLVLAKPNVIMNDIRLRGLAPPMQVEMATWSRAGRLDYWVKERQQWLGRVRGTDGRQQWIQAVDLRPASGSQRN